MPSNADNNDVNILVLFHESPAEGFAWEGMLDKTSQVLKHKSEGNLLLNHLLTR
jgi:hypothetical protein